MYRVCEHEIQLFYTTYIRPVDSPICHSAMIIWLAHLELHKKYVCVCVNIYVCAGVVGAKARTPECQALSSQEAVCAAS